MSSKKTEKISKFESAEEDIKTLIRARSPLIYILSDEKERSILNTINEICKKGTAGSRFKKDLLIWDISRGIGKQVERNGRIRYESIDGESTRDPAAALDFIMNYKPDNRSESNNDFVFVLCEFHHYLRDPAIQRRLRVFSEWTSDMERKIIVMLSTKNSGIEGKTIPIELENLVYIYNWPYPDSIHIEKVLNDNIIPNINEKLRSTNPPIPEIDLSDEEMTNVINSCKGMTIKQIEDAVTKSIILSRNLDPSIISHEKKQIVQKSNSVDYIEPDIGLNSIGGLDVLKEWLAQRKTSLSEEAIEFGCDLPKGVLLLGPWGSGKSTAAKAIINEWKIPGLRIDVSKMFGNFVGESESRTKDILNLADSIAPCVVWWEEIEDIFSGTGSNSGVNDGGTSNRVLSLISTWMSEHEGLVFNIFTANDISSSPPKLFRKGRLDEIFIIDLPVLEERKEIFRIHIEKRLKKTGREKHISKMDLEKLAKITYNFSGAEIESVINSAMVKSFNDKKRVMNMDDIEEVISKTIPISRTMKEQIEKIREWNDGRAVRGSKFSPEEVFDKEVSEFSGKDIEIS